MFGTSIILYSLLALGVSATPLQKRGTNQLIRSYRTGKCLTLPAGVAPSNGAALTTGDCATASKWDISPGSGSVIITGTNFALDAGVPQGNNNYGKVWQSYPGSTQQTWYLTNDARIAVTGGNQCLDEGDNGPQTYQCTPGNTNQIWYVYAAGTPPPVSSSAPPVSSTSKPPVVSSTSKPPVVSSSSAVPPPPTATGKTLRWVSDNNKCMTVQSGTPGNGVLVNSEACVANSAAQKFTFMGNGLIQFAGSNFCLDAGSNPASGTQMKLRQCYAGLAQQTWSFPNTQELYQTSNNQCLDLDNSNNSKLQTWTCSSTDIQQQFKMV